MKPQITRSNSRVANLANLWEGNASKQTELIKKEKQIRERQKSLKIEPPSPGPQITRKFSQSTQSLISPSSPKESRTLTSGMVSRPHFLKRSSSSHATPISPNSRKREELREILELNEEDQTHEREARNFSEQLVGWPSMEQKVIPLYDVPVSQKEFECPQPPEALYATQSILNSSLEIDQLIAPQVSMDNDSAVLLSVCASTALTLMSTLVVEQPLLSIPLFNKNVYSITQLQIESGWILKSLARKVKAIYENTVEVSPDIVSGLPDIVYELIRLTRQSSRLDISKDMIPSVKVIISTLISLLNCVGYSSDSHTTMYYSIITDHLINIHRTIRIAALNEKRTVAENLSSEELSVLTKTSSASVQQLFKMVGVLSSPSASNSLAAKESEPNNIPSLVNQILGYLSSCTYFQYQAFVDGLQHFLQEIYALAKAQKFSETKLKLIQTKASELLKNCVALLSKLPPVHIITHANLSQLRAVFLKSFAQFLKTCLD